MSSAPQKPRKDPRQERSKVTVDAILEAAGQLLAQQDAESAASGAEAGRKMAVSTTHIAERAGVSVGSLYQYFPNREALVSALLRRFVQKRFAQIERVIAEVEPLPLEEGLRRLAARLIELELAHSLVMRSLMKWFVRVGDFDLIAEADREAERALAELLERIRSKTRAVDPVLGGFFLFHALRNTLGMACFREPDMLRSAAVHEELSRLLFGYLRPD